MSGIAEHLPAFQVGAQVTPSEVDRYEVYTIIGPMMGTFSWGTVAGTNAQVKNVVFGQVLADYPRSISASFVGASGSVVGGTFTVFGKNQFGVSQTESFAIGTAANGGTVNGTKVWASFASAAGTVGTGDPGSGTLTLYPTAVGTTALFGLPATNAGSTNVKMITFGSTGVAKAVNGGTIGAFVDVVNSAIKAPNTITTPAGNPTWIQVWYKPSYVNLHKANMAGL